MTITKTLILTLNGVTCAHCGVVYGLESQYEAKLRESHETFYCPNGHRQHFPAQTEKERRIAELERQAQALTNARDFWSERYSSANASLARENRRVNGYKGVVTRMKRRAIAGRCPCCSHQFKDLERHMKAQHPKYDPDRAANALAEKANG